MATLGEFQVPTIVDTEIATKLIKQGQEITVDAINCNIYEGLVKELLNFCKERRTVQENSTLQNTGKGSEIGCSS
jgi:pyruvate,water dikinase